MFLTYTGVRHLRDTEYASIFSGITLAIHELGHVLFGFAGETLGVAGGSLAQILAPIAAAALLLRQRDYFGVAVAGAWLSFSLSGLATYIGDARAQEMPLVGLTDDPIHDWEYLLDRWRLIRYDTTLARIVRFTAFLSLTGSLALGAWLCWVMSRSRDSQTASN